MKRILLIFGIIYQGFLFCQIEKGSFFAGPGVSFSRSKSETEQSLVSRVNTTRYLNLTARLGYFIVNKTAVGLVWQNSSAFGKIETDDVPGINKSTNKNQINYFGLFARHYKMINEYKIGFFGQLDLMYGIGKGRNENVFENGTQVSKSESTTDLSAFRVGLAPGVVYFVSNRLSLETYFGGLTFVSGTDKRFSNGSITSIDKSNSFNLNFGAGSLYFGLNFYITRKKA